MTGVYCPPAKRCPDCGILKVIFEFPRNRHKHGSYCKPCHNARSRANIKKNHGNSRYYHLRRRYGITPAEFDTIAAHQGGRCAICRHDQATHLDHDHDSGRVRGLLCTACNNGLGLFRDDSVRLRMAAAYLEGGE